MATKRATTKGDRDRLLEHEYDGIKEYDNPLPSWWVWLFWATIVFSVGYFAFYQLGPGPSIIHQYEQEVRAAGERETSQAGAGTAVTEDSLKTIVKDKPAMAAAHQIFVTRCAPCHGPEGQGVIGPNLTDDYWIHGNKLTDILKVISDGVPDKGMPTWNAVLKPQELQTMAAYVWSLHDTHPANPKPPQGTKMPD